MRQPMVAGNWKMNGSLSDNQALLDALLPLLEPLSGDWVVCPPSLYLQQTASVIDSSNIFLGAQNTYCEAKGAFTGEISPKMLADIGCKYVIIGHSERRQLFSENDELVAKKFQVAYDAGLTPIVCVGETQAERETNQTFEVVLRQLKVILDEMPNAFTTAVIAYEPVWAIGTGLTASPGQAQSVHAHIRRLVAERDETVAEQVRILYGGSVKGENASDLFSQPDIDGGLIGGASLKAEEFSKICHSAVTAAA